MNAEVFAEWFRRRGYKIIRTDSSYWFNQGPRVYQAFPYHWTISPSRQELSGILFGHRAMGIRYSTALTASEGKLSYHCVWKGSKYDLTDLPRRARGAVRKGLRNLTIEQISFECLASEGWQLRVDTMQRQHRGDEQQTWWQQMCMTASDLPGFEAWGAFSRGRLVAALLAGICDDCYTLLFQQSATEFLNSGANNALAYVVTHQAIARPDISQVFYGLESLNASEDVDTFKLRMGYAAIPVRQRVVFNPVVSPFLNFQIFRLIKYLAHRNPNNTTLSKAEGMLWFFHDGKRPLDCQARPQALSNSAEAEKMTSLESTLEAP
jgi:hypothetical protein